MIIKDKKGKEHEVEVSFYKGTVICVYDKEMGIPIASLVVTDEGEECAVMQNSDFRKNKEVTDLLINAQRVAILQGAIPATSGFIFSYVHPDHGMNKDLPKMGAKLEVVERNGRKWNKWSIPVHNVLSGKVDEGIRV
jgi:hypothetical protein